MSQDKMHALHRTDEDGNPAGGVTLGTGITIEWQDGPLGRGEDRKEPNGAFVEGVISAAMDRLQWYQDVAGGKFACKENEDAIRHLGYAMMSLAKRTQRREEAGTEGTHQPDAKTREGLLPVDGSVQEELARAIEKAFKEREADLGKWAGGDEPPAKPPLEAPHMQAEGRSDTAARAKGESSDDS